jgi:hypothetical protein
MDAIGVGGLILSAEYQLHIVEAHERSGGPTNKRVERAARKVRWCLEKIDAIRVAAAKPALFTASPPSMETVEVALDKPHAALLDEFTTSFGWSRRQTIQEALACLHGRLFP